jgi:hypothetical protein
MIPALVAGLALGGVYALLAGGLTIGYTASGGPRLYGGAAGPEGCQRQVLQDRAERPVTAHQHLRGALGTTEVPAARIIQEGPQVVPLMTVSIRIARAVFSA